MTEGWNEREALADGETYYAFKRERLWGLVVHSTPPWWLRLFGRKPGWVGAVMRPRKVVFPIRATVDEAKADVEAYADRR